MNLQIANINFHNYTNYKSLIKLMHYDTLLLSLFFEMFLSTLKNRFYEQITLIQRQGKNRIQNYHSEGRFHQH